MECRKETSQNYGFIKELAIVSVVLVSFSWFFYDFSLLKYLFGHEKFDDFFNSAKWAFELPNEGSSYVLSPFLIIFFTKVNLINSNFLFVAYNLLILLIILLGASNIKENWPINICIFFSYPIIFAFSRGNAELLAFACVFLSIAWSNNGLFYRPILILFCACLIKPTALLWLATFKSLTLRSGIIFVALLFIANIFIILMSGRGFENYLFAYKAMLLNYYNSYALGGAGDPFNNSAWVLIKLTLSNFDASNDTLNKTAFIYKYLSAAISIVSIFTAFVLRKNYNYLSFYLICLAVAFYPFVSADYRLAYYMLPFVFAYKKLNNILFVITCLVLLPKYFYQLPTGNTIASISINSILNSSLQFFIFLYIYYTLVKLVKR